MRLSGFTVSDRTSTEGVLLRPPWFATIYCPLRAKRQAQRLVTGYTRCPSTARRIPSLVQTPSVKKNRRTVVTTKPNHGHAWGELSNPHSAQFVRQVHSADEIKLTLPQPLMDLPDGDGSKPGALVHHVA